MKQLIMLLIFSVGNLFGYSDSCGTNADINIDTNKYFTNNGWSKPLNRNNLTTDIAYNYDSSIYYCRVNYAFRHGAVDIDASLGEKVYSIDDGEIVAFRRDNNSQNKNMSIIYIKHKTSTGKEFLGIYGHVYLKSGLDMNNPKVKKGEYIGTIKKYNNPHIHFSISTDINRHNTNRWGGIKDGIVNPLEFLETNQNDTSSTNSIAGIFDGAGSLVSPNESCWGCDKDEARMHPHPGTGSTVVFQWLYDSDTCSQIDLIADSNIEVAIKAKAWDEHLTKKAFKVTLGTNPVTLTRPSDNIWTTLAITSTNPINYMTPIYAYCKTPSDSYHSGNSQSIDKELVDVTYDYFWTGTGSLITQATQRGSNAYGIDKDVAVTFRSKNSLTSFQWYASQNCSKVEIKGYNESSSNINGVYIKGWAEENWSSNKCSSLPCTIIAPSINAYYIIKIKSSPDAIKSGYLQTKCVQ